MRNQLNILCQCVRCNCTHCTKNRNSFKKTCTTHGASMGFCTGKDCRCYKHSMGIGIFSHSRKWLRRTIFWTFFIAGIDMFIIRVWYVCMCNACVLHQVNLVPITFCGFFYNFLRHIKNYKKAAKGPGWCQAHMNPVSTEYSSFVLRRKNMNNLNRSTDLHCTEERCKDNNAMQGFWEKSNF